MSSVGFIGLGNMGGHMARNLLRAGHRVVVYDTNTTVVDAFKVYGSQLVTVEMDTRVGGRRAAGEQPCRGRRGGQGAWEGYGMVTVSIDQELITMLPSTPHVRSVYTGSKGILE